MATEKFANNALTVLSGPIDSTTQTILVDSASLFPTLPQFRIRIDDEILLVTGVSGTTFTATRGVESTSNVSHLAGARVTHVITSGALAQFGSDLLSTPGTIEATLPNGTEVPITRIVTTQAGVGGKLAVDSLGQAFPRTSEFSKLISGSQANLPEQAIRALSDGTVYALRLQDRYTDTGQVRSRAWNDSTKYLIIGETGDVCEQIWWTGNNGVKTAAGATSCIRIPNADIDPDAAFSLTFFVASLPGNTVPDRPLVLVGSQHGTTAQARAMICQHGSSENATYLNSVDAGMSLAGICPYVITMSCTTGAGGSVTYYRNGASLTAPSKLAGTIYPNDHAIGGWWDEAGGVWHSYSGFYVFAVVIHSRALSPSDVYALHRALIDPTEVKGAISIGQSNNNMVAGEVPDAPVMPDYRSAQNETSYDNEGTGWGPVDASTRGATDYYSVTQGIAQHLPGYVFFKIARNGHQLLTFYDWTALDYISTYEPLLRAAWQLGCAVDLEYIFIISCESEADVSISRNDVRDRLLECVARFRRGFQVVPAYQADIRAVVSKLNSQYALIRPIGTPLVQQGQYLFAEADVNARLVDVDVIPLGGDNTHYSANNRILVGGDLGECAIATTWTNPVVPIPVVQELKALVVNNGSANITPLTWDGDAWTAWTPINVGTQPTGVTITSDGLRAVVANFGSNNITPLAWGGSEWIAGTPVNVGTGPRYVAITADGLRALVTNATTNNVTPLSWNGSVWVAGTPVNVGTAPFGVAITADGLRALVANNNSGNVTPLSWNGSVWIAGTPVNVGSSPHGVAITADGLRALVVNYGSANVTPLSWNGSVWIAGTPVSVGASPLGVVITSDGINAVVTSGGAAGVTPLTWSGSIWEAESVVSVGATQYNLGLSPDDTQVVVASASAGTAIPLAWDGSVWITGTPISVGTSPVTVAVALA